jgi:hypothetical protein
MATDVTQSLSELNILFQQMLLDMLGYEMSGSPAAYDPSAFYFVRVAWPTDGAPAWKITEDICFLRVTEEDDAINRQRESDLTYVDALNLNEATRYTRVIALNLIFYGPNSWDNAQTVRDKIFRERYLSELATEKIYLIPDIKSPNRVPESFQSRWWERVDLEIRFNEGIVKNQDIGTIGSAKILVYNKDGLLVERTITEDD